MLANVCKPGDSHEREGMKTEIMSALKNSVTKVQERPMKSEVTRTVIPYRETEGR